MEREALVGRPAAEVREFIQQLREFALAADGDHRYRSMFPKEHSRVLSRAATELERLLRRCGPVDEEQATLARELRSYGGDSEKSARDPAYVSSLMLSAADEIDPLQTDLSPASVGKEETGKENQ